MSVYSDENVMLLIYVNLNEYQNSLINKHLHQHRPLARLLLYLNSLTLFTPPKSALRLNETKHEASFMNKWIPISLLVFGGIFLLTTAQAAEVVPPEIQMPGTQPNEVGNFESPDRCDNCHAGYDVNPEIEPATGWRGAAMGNAGRDPVFWATLAIAEQDFDGAGDLCIRCHSAGGWYGGRSTPTDGSGLAASDDNGIDCDTCHTMTNPDNSEHAGVMNAPFTANCSDDDTDNNSCSDTSEGYYGSGMLSLWGGGSDKLGPYSDAEARHQFMQSSFHRNVDFCGSCHDVSNSAVGDLAPNHGTQDGAPPVIANGVLGGPIEEKAAFNNPPYAYGIVERTFSEYKASAFPTTPVSAFTSLPADLRIQGGSIEVTHQAANIAGTGGNYEDGSTRYFSCQSCHMRPVEAKGCNKNGAPIRKDMPQHDQTGGNYWFANMTQYQDANGTLRLGGGLTGNQILAMDLGQQRAVDHLTQAASLEVNGETVKVINLTGHKLITGYPEGRRMWLRIEWRDADDNLIRVDGEYGGIGIYVTDENGDQVEVESIIDLEGTNTRIYEAHYAVTRDWATTIEALHGPDFVLSYNRISGDVQCTVSDFLLDDNAPGKKDACKGDYHDTFHFALNNYVSHDNRIPPYGMSYDVAKVRNALPVPADQYGGAPGGTYNYWDEVSLSPPTGADHAHIQLLYQGTSWEYIQFLKLANNGQNAFLAAEGNNMMDAWINADVPVAMNIGGDQKMVPPVVMATANWGNTGGGNNHPIANDDAYIATRNTELVISAPGLLGNDSDPDNNDSITAVQDSSSGGSLTLNPNGSFNYMPATDFVGFDSFTYHVVDNHGAGSNSATVTIDIRDLPACGSIGDKGVCSGTPGCEWQGSPRNGTCVETVACTPTAGEETQELTCNDGIDNDCDGLTDADDADCGTPPPPADCSQYSDQNSCRGDAACRWSKKDNLCLNR